jgi:hypothetical protein
MMEEPHDRASLVLLSIQHLDTQARDIEKEIGRDNTYIREKSPLLEKLTYENTKRGLQKELDSRLLHVSGLRISLRMIELCRELLEQEQKRLMEVE